MERRDERDDERGRSAPSGHPAEDDYGYGVVGRDGDTGYGPYGLGPEFGSRYGAKTAVYPQGRTDFQRGTFPWPYRDPEPREDDRGFWNRTRDEAASWFGDDAAAARRARDAEDGPHRGRGPRGWDRDDARLREEVCARLTDDPWVDASDLEVEVRDGEVLLRGSVESRVERRRAEDVADFVPGVRHVINALRVRDRR